jgi:CRP/FNR family transcriptional regulator, cyclic AMP receptor protein
MTIEHPTPPVGVRLLEVDPDLAVGLAAPERDELTRRLVVPAATLAHGHLNRRELDRAPGVSGAVHGFIVLDGLMAIETSLARRACLRLLLAEDLLLTGGDPPGALPVGWRLTVLERARLAVIDDRVMAIAGQRPALLSAMLRRASAQWHQALVQQAISQLPRVEDRLLAVLWSLADRQGVVCGDRIWIRLPVTHEVLARLIGARRPTVSVGLKRLAADGLVIPRAGGWSIARDSVSIIAPVAPVAPVPEDVVTAPDRPGPRR